MSVSTGRTRPLSISCELIDARTLQAELDALRAELEAAQLVGIDIETQDENRHAGLNLYNNAKRHVFDHRRTVITGFSLYVDGSENGRASCRARGCQYV